MQKARRLLDENSVSFHLFLILLSSIALGSNNVRATLRSPVYVRVEHAQKPKFGDFSEKKIS